MIDTIRKAQEEARERLKAETIDENRHAVLLMASYCHNNPNCTDHLPCIECLKMCNVAIINLNSVNYKDVIAGYDFIKGYEE
jgi:hypothetical protein